MQEIKDHESQADTAEKDKEILISQLEESRQQAAELDQQLSTRAQEISSLQRQRSEAEEGAATLNAQMQESRQQVADLERQVSDRFQAAQGLQSRAETAEKGRKRLTSLYFQLTKQLEDASKQATELEQQRSGRTQEVEQIGLRAEAAEKERNELDSQTKGSGRGIVPKLLGSGEPRQQENEARRENVDGGSLGFGQRLRRLLGGSRFGSSGSATPKRPAPKSKPTPRRKPSETRATGVRSVSVTPPTQPAEKPYKLPRFLSK